MRQITVLPDSHRKTASRISGALPLETTIRQSSGAPTTHLQQIAQINQSMSIRNQNQHTKHHSYTGGPSAYLNMQQMMSGMNTTQVAGAYQKFIDHT